MSEKILPPHEMQDDDLAGVISINLKSGKGFNDLGSIFPTYDFKRYNAVALKVYIEKNPIVTLYAIDREKDDNNPDTAKVPVKKFKREMSLEELFSHFGQVDFTITTGDVSIENIEVQNK